MNWTRWNKRDKVWSSATSLLIKVAFSSPSLLPNKDLTKLRRRRQQERPKSNRFDEQNNNSARASRFFVHFFAVPAQLRREMTKY